MPPDERGRHGTAIGRRADQGDLPGRARSRPDRPGGRGFRQGHARGGGGDGQGRPRGKEHRNRPRGKGKTREGNRGNGEGGAGPPRTYPPQGGSMGPAIRAGDRFHRRRAIRPDPPAMIAPMAKIRVLGPSSRLSAVIALFQEIGAIHIESAPAEIRRLQSDIPVIRRHVLDPAAQQTRATLETTLEKVRQLVLILPSLLEGTEGEGIRDLVPEPSGADPLKAVNVQLDTLSARAASLVADLKRHQDEQSLFSRYDKVLKVLSPLIGMVRESRELECTGLILSSKEAAVVSLLEDALSLLTDGR